MQPQLSQPQKYAGQMAPANMQQAATMRPNGGILGNVTSSVVNGSVGTQKELYHSSVNPKAHALMTRFDGDFTINGKPLLLRIDRSEKSHAETGLNVWDAGIVLAKYFEHRLPELQQQAGKPRLQALELGCGTGVAGLSLALQGQDVILSDKTSLTQHVQGNIQMNSSNFQGGTAQFQVLDWNSPPPRNMFPPFDIVFGSDVLWHESFVDPFMNMVAWALSNSPGAQVLLAQKRRDIASLTKFEQAAARVGLQIEATVETEPLGQWGHPDVVVFHMRR
jgi:predicted nicotinamide N-methyase